MRFLIYLLIATTAIVSAGGLEVTSKDFFYKEGDSKAEFSGNVVAKEGDSVINSEKLIVFLDKKNEAKKYKAVGNVTFTLKNPKKKRDIKGSCGTLTFIPQEDKFILIGNVVLHDNLNDRDVFGDEVVIDNKKGTSKAKSNTKKPVKFIFETKTK
jgi:lipopolysaccharide export system protein LptA